MEFKTVEERFEDAHQRYAAKPLAFLFLNLTEGQKAEICALPLDRQLWLLKVPTKQQARFKRDGAVSYCTYKTTFGKRKAKERRREDDIHYARALRGMREKEALNYFV